MGAAGRRLMETRFSISNFREAIRNVADTLVPVKE
jgi:hypothetical protein